jgi:hypothetical protein
MTINGSDRRLPDKGESVCFTPIAPYLLAPVFDLCSVPQLGEAISDRFSFVQ